MYNGDIPSDPVEQVLRLKNIMIARATHNHAYGDAELYVSLREALMRNRDVGPRLPRDVRVCGSLGQFWGSIKAKYSRYDERRQYLQEEFEPLPAYLESESTSPVDDLVDDVLTNFSAEEVQRVWKRALERRENDPEAAITSARSLVEAVCKHILDEAGEQYNNQGELKRLYRQAAGSMNLAPDQQSEQVFKQLLGACTTIVGSLYSIRNRFGDAHGRSSSAADPSSRHAELAVNVAGSLAIFLVRTKLEEDMNQSS